MPGPSQSTHRDEERRSIPPALIWLLAIGAGVGVANVYYIQPVVPLVRETFGIGSEEASLVPAVSQAGYALGMLLLAPLGDLIDRKRLVLAKSILLVLALLATALAPNFSVLLAVSLAVGLLGSLGQDFVPMAAQLATAEERGRTIGLVTTGLLCGILLSRTLGGVVGDLFGWRAIYALAATMVALVGVAV